MKLFSRSSLSRSQPKWPVTAYEVIQPVTAYEVIQPATALATIPPVTATIPTAVTAHAQVQVIYMTEKRGLLVTELLVLIRDRSQL